MSELKVDKISPNTGTAFTFGDSGDTFTIPSGATITNSGTATGFGGGKVQQIKYTVNSAYSAAANVAMPFDDTIPQISEGVTAGIDTAITPTSASNILVIQGIVNGATVASGDMNYALFQDSTTDALAAWKVESSWENANHFDPFPFIYVMLAGTTSSTTFKVRLGAPSATTNTFVNGGQASGRKFGGVSRTVMTVTEYTP